MIAVYNLVYMCLLPDTYVHYIYEHTQILYWGIYVYTYIALEVIREYRYTYGMGWSRWCGWALWVCCGPKSLWSSDLHSTLLPQYHSIPPGGCHNAQKRIWLHQVSGWSQCVKRRGESSGACGDHNLTIYVCRLCTKPLMHLFPYWDQRIDYILPPTWNKLSSCYLWPQHKLPSYLGLQ